MTIVTKNFVAENSSFTKFLEILNFIVFCSYLELDC